ncbi:MAG: polysaccharide biosynthesis C-terminal domain-containing protein [Bacteroidales bacterium]|jgi:O-antigen/teichoic acid export membrane protein|nr:polysaccharide biosynthesis C-terminal domain-containing protein [Bacteroidales bacterium]
MPIPFKVNNIAALQTFQFLRFLCFLVISIYFTKVPLSETAIGDWEMLLYISGALSYFWVTGIMQSFLPLAQRSLAFVQHKRMDGKSPELYNAFILLLLFSIAFALLILLIYSAGPEEGSKIPYPFLLVVYFILSNTTPLIEHIYLLQNKSLHIFWYGIISTFLQILAVCIPVMAGWGLEAAIWGLIGMNFLRFLWLIRMLYRYAEFKLSVPFILNNLYVGYPIMFSALLSGSTQYLDGLVATIAFDKEKFAIFRYGCKELPFVVMMTSGLHNALIPRFSVKKDIPAVLKEIKVKSLRLMHILFPLSIFVMMLSKWLYGKILFNESFYRSADVFMVYQLMIISRIVFPQTILIGMKKTKVLMRAAIIEVALNIPTSLFFVQYYGVVGIALGSGLIHIVEKFVLIGYVYRHLKIPPRDYIAWNWYVFYSVLIGIMFILIDHRIIYIL